MKNILQKLVLPTVEETGVSGLFYSFIESDKTVVFPRKDKDSVEVFESITFGTSIKMSFYSYFNIFSIDRWKKYTSVNKVGLHLEGKGRCMLTVWARTAPDVTKVVHQEIINLGKGYESPEIDLKHLSGLLYFDLTFLEQEEEKNDATESDNLSSSGAHAVKKDLNGVAGGYFWTSIPPLREVNLNIIVTTFKREEYVRAIIKSFKDGRLFSLPGTKSGARLMFVDNGRTLDENGIQPEEHISIIPNPNTGGAGGFSRGMMESMADANVTHFLLMDDDIDIKPESIARAMNLMRYARDSDLCLGGAMLNGLKRWMMHEQGARIREYSISPNKYNIDLLEEENLWRVSEEELSDYYGWWFFLMPRVVCEKIGLAIPIFFRGDDIDFSFRVQEAGFTVVELNGVCVWHEPFIYKDNPAQFYYDVRNQMLMVFTRDPNKRKVSAAGVTGTIFHHYAHAMLCHRYHRAEIICEAIRDFLKGPDHLEQIDAEALNKRLMSSPEEKIGDLSPRDFDAFRYEVTIEKKPFILTRLAGWLSLGGLLVPSFLRKSDAAGKMGESLVYQMLPSLESVDTSKGFRARKIIYIDRTVMKGFSVEIQSWRGIKLWLSGVVTLAVLFCKLPSSLRAFNAKARHMTSPEEWRRRFNKGKGN